MNPSVWGPPFWRFIHLAALAYPRRPDSDDIASYRQFFFALAKVIPCPVCANNYFEHLIELPIDPFLKTGRLFEWTVEIHNMVNRENGKTVLSAEEALEDLVGGIVVAPCGEHKKKPSEYNKRLGVFLKQVAAEHPELNKSERMRLAHKMCKA